MDFNFECSLQCDEIAISFSSIAEKYQFKFQSADNEVH